MRLTFSITRTEFQESPPPARQLANSRRFRKRHLDDQPTRAVCLNLVTNAVVVWNTIYMWEVIQHLRREGRQIDDADLKHLTPARYEHINGFWCNFSREGRLSLFQLLLTPQALLPIPAIDPIRLCGADWLAPAAVTPNRLAKLINRSTAGV